jgi:DNA-binding transcriptional MerR regulator
MSDEPRLPAPADRWLSLSEAARLYGVHPVTLRVWADRGLVEHSRTLGGHRRFSERSIQSRVAAQSAGRTAISVRPLVDRGLDYTRRRLAEPGIGQALTPQFDEVEREQRRQDGRALLGLVMQYVGHWDEEPALIDEARRIGAGYAEASRNSGVSLGEAVAATLFFRDAIVESILSGTRGPDAPRVIGRVNQILNAYQLALIDSYLAGRQLR